MKPYPLNTLAVWYPMNTDSLSIKAYMAGYPYMRKGILVRSTLDKPVSRYAKNYELNGERYSLCIISTETDIQKMEDWLDVQSRKVKAHDINGFTLLPITYG